MDQDVLSKGISAARKCSICGGYEAATDVRQNRNPVQTPAQAFWDHRDWLVLQREMILKSSAAIGCPGNFSPYQWAQIAAFTADFRPDLILELGRRFGNSTACFTQVANYLGGEENCKVLSLCLSDDWQRISFPKLITIVPPQWFAPADVRQCNILTCDIEQELHKAQRVAVFWDAHGFEVAEWVLGELLPKLAVKAHIVIMHDLSDARFAAIPRDYGKAGLWKGISASDPAMMIGHIYSKVAQAISIVDFCTRNHLSLYSADESFHTEIAGDVAKCATLKQNLGDELFQLQCHWFWFTLSDVPKEITFPKFTPSPGGSSVAHDYADLRAELEAIHNSAGWKALNRWRSFCNSFLPRGSLRRRLYESVKARLIPTALNAVCL